jgi:hypothetical protein
MSSLSRLKPEKLIIAHVVTDGTATEVISKALGWLDRQLLYGA